MAQKKIERIKASWVDFRRQSLPQKCLSLLIIVMVVEATGYFLLIAEIFQFFQIDIFTDFVHNYFNSNVDLDDPLYDKLYSYVVIYNIFIVLPIVVFFMIASVVWFFRSASRFMFAFINKKLNLQVVRKIFIVLVIDIVGGAPLYYFPHLSAYAITAIMDSIAAMGHSARRIAMIGIAFFVVGATLAFYVFFVSAAVRFFKNNIGAQPWRRKK